MTRFQKKLAAGLLALALLSPLGILLPRMFHASGAWGEWGAGVLEKLLGFVPEGMKRHTDLWKAPLPDYSVGDEKAPLASQLLSYIISGIIGVFLVGLAVFLIARLMGKREK